MAHPHPPHQSTSADVSRGLGAIHPSKDFFYAPSPLHSQVPSSQASTEQSGVRPPYTMVTAFFDPATPKDQQPLPQPFLGLDDASVLQWSANPELPPSRLYHDTTSYPLSAHYAPGAADFLDFTPNGLPYTTNYTLTYPTHDVDPADPRSYVNGIGLAGSMSTVNMAESYPPSAYVLEPPKPHEAVDLSDHASSQLIQLNDDYEQNCSSSNKVEEVASCNTPYSSVTDTRCSTPHDDLHIMTPRDLKNEDENVIDKEQPYAQLIYRALMEAPDKTMILRDIYEWFKKNTDKAADKGTKGWQNSIRHNLSMNGAFEKVDQLCDDLKKGFMWKLSDTAIQEGVKSTTRYRSKQPNKRGHRSQQPLPQRQASGAKGGQAARRAAKLRRTRANERNAHLRDPYMCRSVPSAYSQSAFDSPTSYPSSPYYNSEVDFGQPSGQDGFGSPFMGPRLDLSGSASPLSHGSMGTDTAYVLPHDPAEPLFYGTDGSPSPSASEPMTPESQGDYYLEMGPPGNATICWDDISANYHG